MREVIGRSERAEILRRPRVPPLPDARARGFIPPAELGLANPSLSIALWVDDWKREAPSAPTNELVTRLDALHPQEREGYRFLIHLVGEGPSRPHYHDAFQHLLRERPRAWPMMVLALKTGGPAARFLRDVLTAGDPPPDAAAWLAGNAGDHPTK